MDKDAAHHANIALHMLEHNDYFSLVDRQTDYLDKPHFLFWTSALSFKIFGVNTFGHRFPAIIFSLIAVYSTYKLTRHLTNRSTAKIAALMLATAQGFCLSINDARMETPLSAGIIFGLWQLIVFIDKKRFVNVMLAALGAAVAFSTKGWIGVVIIFIAAFFYVVLQRKWKILASPLTWLFIPFFALFISPVLYAYYYQFDLHPEKVVRNMTNISGVKFILWDQNFERFGGDNFIKGGRNSSVFFLYHTFIWAFFPWCIAAYLGLFYWLRRIFYLRKWKHPANFAALAFIFILFTISWSKFKMPHYIFMLMPLAAIFTAPYLRLALSHIRGRKVYFPLQLSFIVLVIIAAAVINYWFFPPQGIVLNIIAPALLIAIIFLLVKKWNNRSLKILYLSAAAVLVFNFLLNFNFFPRLLQYQGGNELVQTMRANNIQVPDSSIVLIDNNAHTFDFYSGHNHAVLDLEQLNSYNTQGKYFVLTAGMANYIRSQGFTIDPLAKHPDYNVARMKLKFLNPATRDKQMDTLMLVRLIK
jgi:4-amino-4-deoxy-L-arabinose transferase-like glycosyltransferase